MNDDAVAELAKVSRELSNVKLILGTLIVYLQRELGTNNAEQLLKDLERDL